MRAWASRWRVAPLTHTNKDGESDAVVGADVAGEDALVIKRAGTRDLRIGSNQALRAVGEFLVKILSGVALDEIARWVVVVRAAGEGDSEPGGAPKQSGP